MKILVIGGGIFGSEIACELSEYNNDVTLIDKNKTLMNEASRVNHNRVHFGYHYPRSLDTTKQCLDSIPSFFLNYGKAIVSEFPNYYAISNNNSLTNKEQFIQFCKDANIDFREEYPSEYFLRKEKLSASFRVKEPIFDIRTLKRIIGGRLEKTTVKVLLDARINYVKNNKDHHSVQIDGNFHNFDKIVNVAYAGLNEINVLFDVRPMELSFEDTVIPIFELDSPKIGLTIMDGPFCSIMPYGNSNNKFLLWHVDGSVLSSSTDANNLRQISDSSITIADRIFKMSDEFMPFMKDVKLCDLLRTIKVLYKNKYDSRISEIQTYSDAPNFISVLSGKIMCSSSISYQVRELLMNDKFPRKILV